MAISAVMKAGSGYADGSRPPLQKVRDQAQARCLALLRVELHAEHCITADDCRYIPCIVDMGQPLRLILNNHMIRMDKIGMIAC